MTISTEISIFGLKSHAPGLDKAKEPGSDSGFIASGSETLVPFRAFLLGPPSSSLFVQDCAFGDHSAFVLKCMGQFYGLVLPKIIWIIAMYFYVVLLTYPYSISLMCERQHRKLLFSKILNVKPVCVG